MDERLAQPYDEMFERNIAHVGRRGREVEIWVEGIPEPKVGFAAGLDEEYLQLCLTKNANLASIRRDLIASMDETGTSLGKLIRESRGNEDEYRVNKIRDKIGSFQKRASYVLKVAP